MNSPFIHLIGWALILFAALSGYGYGYAVLSDKSVSVAALQSQIEEKTETAGRIASARLVLAELANDEAVVLSYFVPETSVVPFIADLEKRVRSQGAALKVLSVSTGGSAKQPTLVLALSIDGTFDAVMRSIGVIEYAPYHLLISKFALSENGKNGWHADLGVTVGSVAASTATSTSPAAKGVSLGRITP